jgi:hypothetical protein
MPERSHLLLLNQHFTYAPDLARDKLMEMPMRFMMKTLRLSFAALALCLLTEMPIPDGSYDSLSGVSQAADVPSEVRGG